MTRSNQAAAIVAAAILSFCLTAPGQAQVPDSLSYQGYLTDEAGSPINGERQFRFSIYNVETGGSPLWVVDQILPVDQGLFTAELGGPHTPFRPPGLFDQPLWLGVEAGFDGEMLPRRPLTTVGFSFKAEDADALQGHSALELDQSLHVAATANPHAVTAGQAGAVATGDFTTHAANDSAHHPKTTSFNELSGQVPWSVLSGIPSDIADGDNDSGGDITGVSAGYGLDGGGAIGSVALALDNPLALTGDLLLNTGNLGIGVTNPNRRLYVVEHVTGLGYALKLDNPHVGIGQTAVGILFSTEGTGGGAIEPLRGKGGLAYVSTGTWNRGAFHFLQDTGANSNNPELDDAVMTIANNGNIGVGTSTPQARLDVAGNIRADNISWDAKTSFYTVPGLAFLPDTPTANYTRDGNAVPQLLGTYLHNISVSGFRYAFAPVFLPHNARVVKVTAYWSDWSNRDVDMHLMRLDLDDVYAETEMAEMSTSWDDPCCDIVQTSDDTSIVVPDIDNLNYRYHLEVALSGDIAIRAVTIEYTTTGN